MKRSKRSKRRFLKNSLKVKNDSEIGVLKIYHSDQADDSDDDRLVIDQLAEDHTKSETSTKYRFPSGPYIETDSEATPTKPKHIPVDTSDDESMPELEDASEEMPALGKKHNSRAVLSPFRTAPRARRRRRTKPADAQAKVSPSRIWEHFARQTPTPRYSPFPIHH